MRFFVSIVFTAVLAFIAGLWMDWWSIALVAFFAGLIIYQSPIKAFFGGFFGIFILWGALSWFISSQNNDILAKKIASILPLSGNPFLLIIVTAFVGALVAGIAAISGSFLRSASR